LYPSLVEKFWAQINTRSGVSPNSSSSNQSTQASADEESSSSEYDSEKYDSAKDEDFQAGSSSSEDDNESYTADWKTVRSIEGMDKTIDGHIRVYIRW
jgi:hypothetical protein